MEIPKYTKGFTLIELLVVIAIISLLSSIVVAFLSSARNKAASAATVSQAKEIIKSVNLSLSSDVYSQGIENDDISVPISAIPAQEAVLQSYIAEIPALPNNTLTEGEYVLMADDTGVNDVNFGPLMCANLDTQYEDFEVDDYFVAYQSVFVCPGMCPLTLSMGDISFVLSGQNDGLGGYVVYADNDSSVLRPVANNDNTILYRCTK